MPPITRYFSVTGAGNFPFELLSHDECFPATLADADKLRMSCPTVADSRTIVFASHRPNAPNVQKWHEAKWPVKRTNL